MKRANVVALVVVFAIGVAVGALARSNTIVTTAMAASSTVRANTHCSRGLPPSLARTTTTPAARMPGVWPAKVTKSSSIARKAK